MNDISYSDRIKDPRWQKKRLEIMDRDNWTCQDCGDESASLHVHHRYYEWGKELWDYPDDALVTLCGDCHQSIHDNIEMIKRIAGEMNSEQLYYAVDIMNKLSQSIPPTCLDTLNFISDSVKSQMS